MTKAIDTIDMMVNSFKKGHTNKLSIVLMIKFFLTIGEITQQTATDYYTLLDYTDNKSIFQLLQLSIPEIENNFALDNSKLEEMIWVWSEYVDDSNSDMLTELEITTLRSQLS